MIGDPNWLYSTIAQSSAAIVAIVGGFITASVLMLTAEKRSLTKQLDLKKLQLKDLEDRMKGEIGNRARDLQTEISLRLTEVTGLTLHIQTFSYPPNLWQGASVLAFLAISGVILPVLVMGFNADCTFFKVMTVSTFCLGIMMVFIYIVYQIRELRR